MLPKFNVSIELNKRKVVPKVGGRIGRMYFFPLHRIFLMRLPLLLIAHVPFPQSYPDITIRRSETVTNGLQYCTEKGNKQNKFIPLNLFPSSKTKLFVLKETYIIFLMKDYFSVNSHKIKIRARSLREYIIKARYPQG